MTYVIVPVFVLGGLFVVYILLLASKEERRTKRRRATARQCSIGEVRDREYVRIVGKVAAADEPTKAPLSGRPCVFWHLAIREDISDQSSGTSWITRDQTRAGIAISVIDDTGSARVHLERTEHVTTEEPGERWSWLTAIDIARESDNLALQRFIADTDFKPGAGRAAEVIERIIPDGDMVVVWGVAAQEPDPDGAARATGVRGPTPTRPIFDTGPEHRPLEVTAHVAPHMGWDL